MELASNADELALLIECAQAAAPIALHYFERPHSLDVKMKGGTSPVSEGDLAVDRFLKDALMSARPHYGWLSEETADGSPSERMGAARTFVVDPIDGTRAYIAGEHFWCISAALVEQGVPLAGVLVCPALNQVFAAAQGFGATLDGKPIAPVTSREPGNWIAAKSELFDALGSVVDKPLRRHPHVPSLAYRLAMVANSDLAGTFVRQGAHDWDIAAAMVLMSETGCVLQSTTGDVLVLNQEETRKPALLACHPDMATAMMGVAVA